jgi:uncharacterized protein (UPF0210 family)
MRIRSITAFTDISYPLESGAITALGEALGEARAALQAAGLEVQSLRLATQPFPEALAETGPGGAGDLAQDIQALAFVHELDYISLGPVRLSDPAAFVEAMPAIFETTENVFATVTIATPAEGASLPRIRRTADLIRRVSRIGEDGFANLRLTALANVKPWSPFFPAAYHDGGPAKVAIATESADLALSVLSAAHSLQDAHDSLVRAVEAESERIQAIVEKALSGTGITFEGIDFSLAPYPTDERSVGAALEKLGLPAVGEHGTLMASAFLTDCLDRAEFKRTGFSGLMLPVLEDSVLGRRAAEEKLTVSELLMYSAVCGTGLDTIPLPGEISQDALAAIMVDVAALALRLNKPLTSRLMPLPGKEAGDETGFDFEYFANSRVMPASTESLSGLLAGDESVMLGPIRPR